MSSKFPQHKVNQFERDIEDYKKAFELLKQEEKVDLEKIKILYQQTCDLSYAICDIKNLFDLAKRLKYFLQAENCKALIIDGLKLQNEFFDYAIQLNFENNINLDIIYNFKESKRFNNTYIKKLENNEDKDELKM